MMMIGARRRLCGLARAGAVIGIVWSCAAAAADTENAAKPDSGKAGSGMSDSGTSDPGTSGSEKSDSAKTDRQTLLIIRHAEKPPNGLGQLSCRGLNRALALPSVIEHKFGKPDAIFAAAPKPKEESRDAWYDYVRPLATVEPTAIRFGLPVYADYPFEGIDQLQDAMASPRFRNATVLIAWEHVYAARFVHSFVEALGGDKSAIPAEWAHDEFDAIWKLTIERKGDAATVRFATDKEGLNDQPDLCPNSAAPPLAQPSPFR